MKLQAIILSGGKSRRFGKDKALAMVDGTPMLAVAVNLLRSMKLEPVVITAEGRDYSFLDCPVETDVMEDKGPIGGLLTAFTLFKKTRLLILTCDMPSLTEAPLKKLIDAHNDDHQATVFDSPDFGFQPFPGIYAHSLKEQVLSQISQNDLSMQHFLAALKKVQTLPCFSSDKSFVNINAASDLKQFISPHKKP